MSINAISIAPAARDWLANTHHPRVLHLFDHACNLINVRGEVLSIVTTQIGNGPFNLVIPRFRKPFERLSDGDEAGQTSEVFSEFDLQSTISINAKQLNLGDLAINTGDSELWYPSPDWERLHAMRDDILNQIMSLQATPSDAEGKPNNPLTTPFPVTIYQSLVSDLCSALATVDISSAIKIASKLSGLGAGLTPVGDDFMMGAIYATWIIHPPEIASAFANAIAETAAPLTTSLSAAWLRSAGKGEAGILWHAFFESLLAGNTADIQLQITRLLSVGATSGADALAGFTGTFSCWAELASSKIP